MKTFLKKFLKLVYESYIRELPKVILVAVIGYTIRKTGRLTIGYGYKRFQARKERKLMAA